MLNRQNEFYENLNTSNNPDTEKIKQLIKKNPQKLTINLMKRTTENMKKSLNY